MTPTTANFISNPKSFAQTFSILCNEAPINALRNAHILPLAINNRHNLATVTFTLAFKIEPLPNNPNTAVLSIHPANTATTTPCYFLPYRPDAGVTMQLGNNARYFFTSLLTGCSVRVHGTRAAPFVTHANAAQIYNTAKQTEANNRGMAVIPVHPDAGEIVTLNAAEAAASVTAQNAIDLLLPAIPHAALHGTVRKADYLGELTPANLASARRNFKLKKFHHTLLHFNVAQVQGHKPEIGAFVFGVRVAQGWKFYLQSSIGIQGQRETGFLGKGVKVKHIAESAVLSVRRFFP